MTTDHHEEAALPAAGHAPTAAEAAEHGEHGAPEATAHTDTGHAATETSGQALHIPTLFAEPLLTVGPLTITNSLFTGWIVVALLIVASVAIRRKLRTIPVGAQNYIEVVVEKTLDLADSVTGDRNRSLTFLPYILPLFIFITLANWFGLLPGVGSIGFTAIHDGHEMFIPILRGATADLNFTLAIAIASVIVTHIAGVILVNGWSHLNRFLGIDLLLEIPRKVIKERDFTAPLVNFVKFFVGIVEIISEFSKVASLSLRLFGNVFAGEVLLTVITSLIAFIIPIPFILLELLVGVVQGFIFSLLTLVFLTILSTEHEHDEEEHGHAEPVAAVAQQ